MYVLLDMTFRFIWLCTRRTLVGLAPPYRIAADGSKFPAMRFPILGWLWQSQILWQLWQVTLTFSWEPQDLGQIFSEVTLVGIADELHVTGSGNDADVEGEEPSWEVVAVAWTKKMEMVVAQRQGMAWHLSSMLEAWFSAFSGTFLHLLTHSPQAENVHYIHISLNKFSHPLDQTSASFRWKLSSSFVEGWISPGGRSAFSRAARAYGTHHSWCCHTRMPCTICFSFFSSVLGPVSGMNPSPWSHLTKSSLHL